MTDSLDPALDWTVLTPVVAGALAVWYVLPSPHRRPLAGGVLAGLIALAGVGAFLIRGLGQAVPATVEAILFFGFAGLAIAFAFLMIANRNPARSALCFALVVLSTCGLFLLLAAPFLAAATIIIYAGAIIVTFLFVIMLSHQEGPSSADHRSREPALAAAAGFILLATLLVGLQRVYDDRSIEAVIDEARSLAAADRLDILYQSGADPASVKQDEAIKPSRKAERFVAAARRALNRVAIADTRGAGDTRLTEHATARAVANSLDDLERTGFRLNDVEDVRTNCDRVANGLAELLARRGSGPPADVVLSPYGAVDQLGATGPKRMPSANVSALGRVLFADHLLAIELAGTLLLIATVGAIAIAGGRRGKVG